MTVKPPKPGDRIRALSREFDDHLSGTIFIRRPSRTVRADVGELDMLQRRLVAVPATKGASIRVRILGDVPLSWFDPATVQPAVERWPEAHAKRHRDTAREVVRRREAPKKATATDPQER